jgi:hypothetical protein
MTIVGHGRVEAAKLIGMTEVPALRIEHLIDGEKRGYVLADRLQFPGISGGAFNKPFSQAVLKAGAIAWSAPGRRRRQTDVN